MTHVYVLSWLVYFDLRMAERFDLATWIWKRSKSFVDARIARTLRFLPWLVSSHLAMMPSDVQTAFSSLRTRATAHGSA